MKDSGFTGKSLRIEWREILALAMIAAGACLAASSTPAHAAEDTYAFDPLRSLTGGCGVTAEDGVADPGCPTDHAPTLFSRPTGLAVGPRGDTYVVNFGTPKERLDVFGADGRWILTVDVRELLGQLNDDYKDPAATLAFWGLALDSLGRLYLAATVEPPEKESIAMVVRYAPSSYPLDKETTYGSPLTIVSGHFASVSGIAIGPEDHLYINTGFSIDEYDGNALVRSGIGAGTLSNSRGIAIGPAGDIFASGLRPGANPIPTKEAPFVSQVYVFDGDTGLLKGEIDGSDTPNCATVEGALECGFGSSFGQLGIAVDWTSGDVFVNDAAAQSAPRVYQFRFDEGSGEYAHLSTISHSFQDVNQAIAVDNGPLSPSPGYLFVTSHPSGVGHLFAFEPLPEAKAPSIEGQSVSGVSTTEALLEAEIDVNGAPTRYRFEYVSEATYLDDLETLGPGHGFDHALRAPEPDASLSPTSGLVPVAIPLSSLEPGTIYRFRAVAENCDSEEPARPCVTQGEGKPGEEGGDARFATYPARPPSPACANEAFRVGPSAQLPDCRAYELVTPGDTNGHPPIAAAVGLGLSAAWSAPLASPAGDSVLFMTAGGSLPGYEGSGALGAEGYRAKRDPSSGWQTEVAGPSGAQSQSPSAGSFSPDHDHWVWRTHANDEGSLGPGANFVREADHSFDLVGQGSLTPEGDPRAVARWISAGGGHVVFTSAVQLEEGAPLDGTMAVYDRSVGGPTEVISLLPGDVTPAPGENASYQGASADGSTVAFKVGGTLYVRVDETETLEVSSEETLFAGLSRDGGWLFYLHPTEAAKGLEPARGDIFAYDTTQGAAAEPVEVGQGGESIPVNVSADGSAVYFVSAKALDEAGEGKAGKDNLYLWDRTTDSIRLVANLNHEDVTGEETGTEELIGGLGLWVSHAVSPNQAATNGPGRGVGDDPSRTTPDGSVLVFESHANLTSYDSQGHRQVYRYDAGDASLLCLSCNPTLALPEDDARLHPLDRGALNALAEMPNVSDDGQRVFFESRDPLVAADGNSAYDVYEWRASGVSGCGAQDGCLALISAGQGAGDSHLYGLSPDGEDVFILTFDTLLPRDTEGAPSIYDARVGGGFGEPVGEPCQGEACRGSGSTPPSLPEPGSAALQGAKKPRKCRRGKRKVRRAGKVRCVKRGAKRHHRQRKRGTDRQAGR